MKKISVIRERIDHINSQGHIALSVFLTAGFPEKKSFVDLATIIIDAGADIIEIGIPFSDPLADGPIIQASSQIALEQKITIDEIFNFAVKIKSKRNIPIVLMTYFNPILKFGVKKFINSSTQSGVNGIIIPDLPIDENKFSMKDPSLDQIYLSAPNTENSRMKRIDEKSSGFVYYVSVAGTTGVRDGFSSQQINNLKNAKKNITKNKLLVGFGISSSQVIEQVKPHCDGVIVGSAVIKRLLNTSKKNYRSVEGFIKSLKKSTKL